MIDMTNGATVGMTPLEAALYYNGLGWTVTPLCWPTETGECGCGDPQHTGNPKNIGKAPLAGRGWQHIVSDEAQIRRWWGRWPQANIGIILEKSNLLIVDPDSPEAVEECRDRGMIDGPTPVASVITGNGRHVYYMRPEGCPVTRKVGKGASGEIDVFTRGFVVAPPSMHSKGTRYRWEAGAISTAPSWPLAQLQPPKIDRTPRAKPTHRRDDTEQTVDSALASLPPNMPMAEWVMIGMAIHSEWSGEGGLVKWDDWSSTGVTYQGVGDLRKRWRGFDGSGGVTLGTLYKAAEDAGWVAPWTVARERAASKKSQWAPSEPPAWMAEADESFGLGVVAPLAHTEEEDGGIDTPGALVGPQDWLAGLRTLTDMGNADRLVEQHGHDLRYVAAQKSWYVWTSDRWQLDEVGLAKERAKVTADRLWSEADTATANAPEDKERTVRGAWNGHAKSTASASRLAAMLTVAQSDERVRGRYEDFDVDPWLLGVKGGVLDLRTADLLPPSRDMLISRQCPVRYDDKAPCPRWEQFVLEIMNGDPEMVSYLQRAVGYSLTGDVAGQALFFLYGHGANGKSTFLKALRALMGDYGAVAAFETFLKQDGQRVRNDIAALSGRRFVVSKEPEEGRALDASTIKDLTSDEAVTARFLFKEQFEFIPTHKLWLAANEKPGVRDSTDGIWRRLKLIPFLRQFADKEQDGTLKGTIAREMPGILRWAVEGCMDWQARGGGAVGLAEPESVRAAVEEYRQEQDILGAFVRERLLLLGDKKTSGKRVYAAYAEWAKDNGHGVQSNRGFTIELKKRLRKTTASHGYGRKGAEWRGVVLAAQEAAW